MQVTVNLPDALRDRVVQEAEKRGANGGLPEVIEEILAAYFQMIDDLEAGNVLMKPPED